jgi:CxxC motif-containing protein (DUF1111 family)
MNEEVALFRKCEERFKHNFSVSEGLGPLFNDSSCFACHGSPGVAGGAGTNVKDTQCTRIARRKSDSRAAKLDKERALTDVYPVDIDEMPQFGGPVIPRKSVTAEFPKMFTASVAIAPPTVPQQAEFVSSRQASQLFGAGLLQAVPDKTLEANLLSQRKAHPLVVGRCAALINRFAEPVSYGRFGWKGQHNTLLAFSIEALQFEMGLTTPPEPKLKTPSGRNSSLPELAKQLPANPENDGQLASQLAYFMALLAPPGRGEITPEVKAGEKVFEKSGCAVCHMPELKTADKVFIPAPDATLPDTEALNAKYGELWYLQPEAKVKLVEVKALENQPVRAYTDLLVHKLGRKLADGIPQGIAGGDYWRTAPLWGLGSRKFYLHDARTSSLPEAIEAHGGQAQESVEAYSKLSARDKNLLLSFLRSL